MFSIFNFKSYYLNYPHRRTTLVVTCLLMAAAPASAQNISNSRICRAYEVELRKVDYGSSMSMRQVTRYQQLARMQEQAKSDAKRYSCYSRAFSSGANSEECRYINTSLHRLDSALNQISKQASTPQQRRMRQAIYMDMQHYNCRNPQNLERLIQENRHTVRQSAGRTRIKQTYKKPKLLHQASLQQPVSMQTAPAVATKPNIVQVKAIYSTAKPSFSIFTEPSMNNTKAAENTPPPIIEAVDYVPNPNVRRVGPEYVPGQ